MSISVMNQIRSMQNATTQVQAANDTQEDNAEITSEDFLQLMMTQLTNQDPTNPTDTSEYMSQQAQLTQLSAVEEMKDTLNGLNDTISTINSSSMLNNQIMQASGLVGKEVSISDPENPENSITGIVDSANFSGSEATVEVNGNYYALGYVYEVAEPATTTSTTNSTGSST